MPMDGKMQSGRAPVDGEKQSGRVTVDTEMQSGRVPLDEEMKSGLSTMERFLAKMSDGKITVMKELIITPEDNERDTAQKYFRYYEPATGKKLNHATAGNKYNNSSWEAYVGNMAYYQEPLDFTFKLHGPYRILDIRLQEGFLYRTLPAIEIWIDRFDFLTPLAPGRLYKAETIEALL